MPLTDVACRAPNVSGKREKRADGGGLFLLVTPTGRKSWSLQYRWEGGQRTLPIGPYPTVGLAAARLRREQAKLDLQAGRDPGAKAGPAAVDRMRLFDTVALEWFNTVVLPTRKPSYAARVWSRLEADVLPSLGDRDVGTIEPADVLAVLQSIEGRGAVYSAKTIGRYVSGVFRFARPSRGLTQNPAEGLSDSLQPTPPKRGQPSLAPREVSDFFAALARPHDDEEKTRLALELVMHTALRSGELRAGRWAEIRGNEWHVPAERMKMKRAHVVPLSAQALDTLARLRKLTGNGPLMFPGRRPGHPISENTVLFAIYGLGFKGRASVHGWRSTFSTWAHESGRWQSEWIETALAHADRDAVRAAYNKAAYLVQRRELMAAWSDWLDIQRDTAELLG